jgi:hypothetical protein
MAISYIDTGLARIVERFWSEVVWRTGPHVPVMTGWPGSVGWYRGESMVQGNDLGRAP